MKLTTLFGSIGLSCVLASSANAQWWLDDFDSYLLGPLASQSLWDEWSGSSGVDANVDNSHSFTTAHSLMIVTNNDVVWDSPLSWRTAAGAVVAQHQTCIYRGVSTGTF
jgi:hypothetical protein